MEKPSRFRRYGVGYRRAREYRVFSPRARIKRRTTPNLDLMRRATHTPLRPGHGASHIVEKLQQAYDSALVCGNSNMD